MWVMRLPKDKSSVSDSVFTCTMLIMTAFVIAFLLTLFLYTLEILK